MPPPQDIENQAPATDEAGPAHELTIPRRGLPWRRVVGSFFLIFGIYWTYALASSRLSSRPRARIWSPKRGSRRARDTTSSICSAKS